jgi:hypothetical protein
MKQRLSQFHRIADYAAVEPTGTFLVFGEKEHDALVVVGRHREKIKHSKCIKLAANKPKITAQIEKTLKQNAIRFATFDAGSRLASLSVLPSQMKLLRSQSKEIGATHIEFDCDETSAKAFLFVVHSQKGTVLWNSSFVATAEGIELSNFHGKPSSFSMKADTFLKLPDNDYSINLYDDYAVFSSGQDSTTIYMRDQEIRKPYTTVFSDRLRRPITLLFEHMS